MRLLGLSLVLGLVGCSQEGAHLTFVAPDGPGSAASFQIVLATPDVIPEVGSQRVSPDGTATQTVHYYLQRATAGVVDTDAMVAHVDGFTVRLEPTDAVVDKAFIPFALIYGADGALVAVGTYHAGGAADPSPILIQRGEIDTYQLDVEPAAQVDDRATAAASEAMVVDCLREDQTTTWHSGVVWRPAGGGELRLVLPADDSGDATGRALDLDCDGSEVVAGAPFAPSSDCDDTRGWFHAGAEETCDGYDTNCDGARYATQGCVGTGANLCPSMTTGMGVALCDDTTGTLGACQGDPDCLCLQGSTGCTKCMIAHDPVMTAGQITPCQPGIGTLSTQGKCDGGNPCTVEVIAVRGGWEAYVAATSGGVFTSNASGVGSSFFIKVKRPEGPGATIAGIVGHATGQVDLVVKGGNGVATYVGVDLNFEGDTTTLCQGTGPFSMACSP